MLHGDPFSAVAGPALAKSNFKTLSQKNASFFQSGLPKGFRHELASIDFKKTEDPLVRHLIATHHGYGRPWFPDCADKSAPGVELTKPDSGWITSFVSLQEKYNIWGLAGMELILRAADARQSMAEQEDTDA